MDYYMEAWQAKWWEKQGLYGTLIWPSLCTKFKQIFTKLRRAKAACYKIVQLFFKYHRSKHQNHWMNLALEAWGNNTWRTCENESLNTTSNSNCVWPDSLGTSTSHQGQTSNWEKLSNYVKEGFWCNWQNIILYMPLILYSTYFAFLVNPTHIPQMLLWTLFPSFQW